MNEITVLKFFVMTVCWQWCSDSLSTDGLWDADSSPVRSSASRKTCFTIAPRELNPDNNKAERELCWNVNRGWSLLSAFLVNWINIKLNWNNVNKNHFIQFQSETAHSVFAANISAESDPQVNVWTNSILNISVEINNNWTNTFPVRNRLLLLCLHGQYIGRICSSQYFPLFSTFHGWVFS